MNATTAVALLVKTPGHSPVKTRLAEGIGARNAQIFHRLSALAMAESLSACARRFPDRLSPYWAVAEDSPEAIAEWAGFPIVRQGEGTFAERMHHVYRELRKSHRSVVIAATDSPEAKPGVWLGAWRALQTPGSVIGPAADGGFYLAGSNLELPETVWSSIPLSTPTASHVLAREMSHVGACRWLPLLDDIDNAADLERLSRRLAAYPGLSRGLARLAEWARRRQEDPNAADLPW